MSRFIYRFSICILTCMGLASCLPAAPPAQSSETPAAVVPARTSQTPTTAATGGPDILPEETDMNSATPAGDSGQRMTGLAREQLAKQLNTDIDQITVVEVKQVVWTEGSLGCPKPNIDYMRMDIPGFRIQLKYGDTIYTYHTDQTQRVVRCDR